MGTIFQQTLHNTRNWLQGVFKRSIFQSPPASHVKFTYHQEIQVSQPEEQRHSWDHSWVSGLVHRMGFCRSPAGFGG